MNCHESTENHTHTKHKVEEMVMQYQPRNNHAVLARENNRLKNIY